MKNTYFKRPRIVLVDDDPGRIEYLENVLFRAGFQTVTMATGALDVILGNEPCLVLSCLPIQHEEITSLGTPVLVMVPDDKPVEKPRPSDSLLASLPSLVAPEVLEKTIRSLLSRDEAQ